MYGNSGTVKTKIVVKRNRKSGTVKMKMGVKRNKNGTVKIYVSYRNNRFFYVQFPLKCVKFT